MSTSEASTHSEGTTSDDIFTTHYEVSRWLRSTKDSWLHLENKLFHSDSSYSVDSLDSTLKRISPHSVAKKPVHRAEWIQLVLKYTNLTRLRNLRKVFRDHIEYIENSKQKHRIIWNKFVRRLQKIDFDTNIRTELKREQIKNNSKFVNKNENTSQQKVDVSSQTASENIVSTQKNFTTVAETVDPNHSNTKSSFQNSKDIFFRLLKKLISSRAHSFAVNYTDCITEATIQHTLHTQLYTPTNFAHTTEPEEPLTTPQYIFTDCSSCTDITERSSSSTTDSSSSFTMPSELLSDTISDIL